MNDLHDLQCDFQEYVFCPGENLQGKVVSTKNASANARLGIYVSAYRARLIEALQSDYPGVQALLGNDDFEKLGESYLETHPSKFPNIRWYGATLVEFLKTTSPYQEQRTLHEMASFEWAMTLAFDAADDPVVSIEDVAAVPPDAWAELRFIPHASIQRLEFLWNAPAIWKAMHAEKTLPPAKKSKAPVSWIMWRKGLATYFRSMSVDEAWALDAMRVGQTFAEICAGLCEWKDEAQVAQHAAGLLKSWVGDALIARLS